MPLARFDVAWRPSAVVYTPGRPGASPIVGTAALSMPWPTADPFLFSVYHDDQYPAGNANMGPAESLRGHRIGSDFGNQAGWNMYHGEIVPGFPRHPHRGFETVTLTRHGVIDHADSLGAAGRFGFGDVQWMTAGRGVQHSEMFPLLDQQSGNRLELFQIWLNLPADDKMAEPCYKMLWAEDLPSATPAPGVHVVTVAGALEGASGPLPAPPPASYAARAESDVAIWTLRLDAGAKWTLPPARSGAAAKRMLYFFKGADANVAGTVVPRPRAIELRADAPVEVSRRRPPGAPS